MLVVLKAAKKAAKKVDSTVAAMAVELVDLMDSLLVFVWAALSVVG